MSSTKRHPPVRIDFNDVVRVEDHDTDGLLITDSADTSILLTFGTDIARDRFVEACADEIGMKLVWPEALREFTVAAAKLLGGKLVGPEDGE